MFLSLAIMFYFFALINANMEFAFYINLKRLNAEVIKHQPSETDDRDSSSLSPIGYFDGARISDTGCNL